jgi:hypothetical protein
MVKTKKMGLNICPVKLRPPGIELETERLETSVQSPEVWHDHVAMTYPFLPYIFNKSYKKSRNITSDHKWIIRQRICGNHEKMGGPAQCLGSFQLWHINCDFQVFTS